jgi:hypothetical protein
MNERWKRTLLGILVVAGGAAGAASAPQVQIAGKVVAEIAKSVLESDLGFAQSPAPIEDHSFEASKK